MQDTSDCIGVKDALLAAESERQWSRVASLSEDLRQCRTPETRGYAWTYVKEAEARLEAKQYDAVNSVARRMMADRGAADSLMISYVYQYSGAASFWQGRESFSIGDYQTAIRHARARPVGSRINLERELIVTLLKSGKYDVAREKLQAAIQVACGHTFSPLLNARLFFSASAVELLPALYGERSRVAEGRRSLDQSATLAREIDDRVQRVEHQSLVEAHRAGYAALDVRHEAAWAHLRESLRLAQSVEADWTATFAHVMGARLALYFGEPDRALHHLDAADQIMEGSGDHSLTADILGLRVAVAARMDNPDLARSTLQRLAGSEVPGAVYQLYRASIAMSEHNAPASSWNRWADWQTVALIVVMGVLFVAGYVTRKRDGGVPGPLGRESEDLWSVDLGSSDLGSSNLQPNVASEAGPDADAARPDAGADGRVDTQSRRGAEPSSRGEPDPGDASPASRLRVAQRLALVPPLDGTTVHPQRLTVRRTDGGLLVAEVPVYTRSGVMMGVQTIPAPTIRRDVGNGLVLLDEGEGRMRLLAIRRMQGHEIFCGFGGEIRPRRVDAVVRGLVVATVEVEWSHGVDRTGADAHGDGHDVSPPTTLTVSPFTPPPTDGDTDDTTGSGSPSGRDPERNTERNPERGSRREAAFGSEWKRPGAVDAHVADVFGLPRSARGDWVDLPVVTDDATPRGGMRVPWRLIGPMLSRSLIVLKRDRGGRPLVAVSHQSCYDVVSRVELDRQVDPRGAKPGVSLAPTGHPVRGVAMTAHLPGGVDDLRDTRRPNRPRGPDAGVGGL